MLKIYALGGSGESGRNCFAIETADAAYLIDCGVKRDVSQTSIGAYPLLTKGLVKKLRAVFLSQVHQDHSAALPLLYHLGYTGNIYTSDESIHTVERFIKKWADYVQSRPGSLPYTGKDMTSLMRIFSRPCPVNSGKYVHTRSSGLTRPSPFSFMNANIVA